MTLIQRTESSCARPARMAGFIGSKVSTPPSTPASHSASSIPSA